VKIELDHIVATCEGSRISSNYFIEQMLLAHCAGPNIPGILPDGVRLLHSVGRNVVVGVLEIPPQLHAVRMSDSYWNTYKGDPPIKAGTYTLAMPWIMILLTSTWDRTRWVTTRWPECYFMTQRLESLEDPLYVPALANCEYFGNGVRMCLGPFIHNEELGKTYSLARSAFFGRAFNYSVTGAPVMANYRKHPDITDLERWQAWSLKDPLFVLKYPWITNDPPIPPMTMGQRLAEIDRDVNGTGIDFNNLLRIVFLYGKTKPKTTGTPSTYDIF